MKKILSLCLALTLLFALAVPAAAAGKTVTLPKMADYPDVTVSLSNVLNTFDVKVVDREEDWMAGTTTYTEQTITVYQLPLTGSELIITVTGESDLYPGGAGGYVLTDGVYTTPTDIDYGNEGQWFNVSSYNSPYAYSMDKYEFFNATDIQCAMTAWGNYFYFTYADLSAYAVKPAAPAAPAANTAYASTQNVSIDGKAVELQAYALKDAKGNSTNYVKLRDVANVLNGTKAQFAVGWDGSINIITGQPYTPNGSEMFTPFSGDRTYTVPATVTKVNGVASALDIITLTDDQGGGYTYYKLRDLGKALGFNVGWKSGTGIFIDSDKPYTDAD